MSEKQKKQTISLAVIMVICVVLTSLLLSNSLQCADCDKKITGKYYISLSERPYCKDCGAEYYRVFPGELDNITDRVDNTARNILVIVELIGFIGAMVVINKKKVAETIKSDGVASVTRKIPVIKEEVKKVVEPIVKKETPIEPKPEIKPEVKPEVESEKTPEVRKEEIFDITHIETEKKADDIPVEKETKVETESPTEMSSISRLKSTMRTSTSKTTIEESDRFNPAGDLQ